MSLTISYYHTMHECDDFTRQRLKTTIYISYLPPSDRSTTRNLLQEARVGVKASLLLTFTKARIYGPALFKNSHYSLNCIPQAYPDVELEWGRCTLPCKVNRGESKLNNTHWTSTKVSGLNGTNVYCAVIVLLRVFYLTVSLTYRFCKRKYKRYIVYAQMELNTATLRTILFCLFVYSVSYHVLQLYLD